MEYLKSLNDPQRDAVLATEGPLMIIAGAGSGKTRVLTYRIAHLMQNGVEPFNILALTFTNKAAREMRKRIESVVGTDARNLWMGTFHSIFAKILRFEAEKIGYTSNFTIYDTEDSVSLIKSILKDFNLDDKVYKPSTVLNRISGAKNRLISWQEYNRNPIYGAEDREAMKPEMGRVYREYCERCFKCNAMDFDDLLFNTNVLFRDHADVLNKYQHKFRYVLVDEFQDTNLSQYLITRKLAAMHQNICVVGDDAQSIYAFRGADIQNILNFKKDYPELTVIKLEQNYRSTKNIVQAANSVIAKNREQLQKNVWTSNEDGLPILLFKAATDNDEGRMVADAIFEEKMRHQYHNRDFAILYRTNSQSRAFEEALRKLGIKYKIVAGLSFYQRKEIKDLIAYLRYTINQNDEEAFKRIINLPKRGIGDTTVTKIRVAAGEKKVSIWEVINNVPEHLGAGRLTAPITEFSLMIRDFIVTVQQKDAFEAASYIAKTSGLLKELFEDKTIEGRARYENVQELLNAIKEFVDSPEHEIKTLPAFLQEVALLTTADEKDDEDDDKVTMMTIHASKGLEFKCVYVVGLEEDLFPSQMMLSNRADLEEERRLFYVAITRAEKKLTLSYALQRYRFGNLRLCEPSRFLEEIDPRYIKVMAATNNGGGQSMNRHTAPITNFARTKQQTENTGNRSVTSRPATPTVNPSAKPHSLSSNFKPSDTSKLKAGMKVEHPKFGFGTVVSVDTSGSDKRAKINFDGHGEKVLILGFAKLMIVG